MTTEATPSLRLPVTAAPRHCGSPLAVAPPSLLAPPLTVAPSQLWPPSLWAHPLRPFIEAPHSLRPSLLYILY